MGKPGLNAPVLNGSSIFPVVYQPANGKKSHFVLQFYFKCMFCVWGIGLWHELVLLIDLVEALRFREKLVWPSGENISLFGRQFGDFFLTSSHSWIAECAVPLELLLDLSTTMPNLWYIRPETRKTLFKCHSPIGRLIEIRGARAPPVFGTTKQVRFQQMHDQGLRQLFLMLSWDLCA